MKVKSSNYQGGLGFAFHDFTTWAVQCNVNQVILNNLILLQSFIALCSSPVHLSFLRRLWRPDCDPVHAGQSNLLLLLELYALLLSLLPTSPLPMTIIKLVQTSKGVKARPFN